MKLNLHKPLCVFDLETTGTQIATDRIVEICIQKIFPDGSDEVKTWRVNPEMPIPEASSAIHGITDEMVANEKTFKELAPEIAAFIKDSDLSGFNALKFDVPLLAEEFLRVGVDFDHSNLKIIDVQNIFHKMEKRTLVAAYKFYCDKDLKDAHSAEADVLATSEVLKAQLERYDDLENNMKFLAEFSQYRKYADLAGMLYYDDEDDVCFAFGKYKGQKATSVFDKDPGYFGWIQGAQFPLYTKKVLTGIKLQGLNTKLK